MPLKPNEIIAALAVKYDGVWEKIFEAVKNKEEIDVDKYMKILEKSKYGWLTILDEGYPERLKKVQKPPFCLFFPDNIQKDAFIELGSVTSNFKPISVVAGSPNKPYKMEMVQEIEKTVTDYTLQTTYIVATAPTNDASREIIDTMIYESDSLSYVGIVVSERSLDWTEMPSVVPSNMCYVSEFFKGVKNRSKYGVERRNRLMAGLSSALFITRARKGSWGINTLVNTALASNLEIHVVDPKEINETDGPKAYDFSQTLLEEGAFKIELSLEAIEQAIEQI